MVAGKSPEPLPSGWSEHVEVKNGRKIKYYTNVPNGKKFYSKKDVISYMKIKGNFCGQNRGIAQRETRSSQRNINSQSLKTAVNSDKSPEWLPPGWIVEEKTRMSGVGHGHTYKCYIDPFGRRFYSKPEVSRHLKIMNCNGPIVEEKKSKVEESSCNKVSQNEKATDDQSCTPRTPKSGMGKQPSDVGSSVAVQSNLVDGLPPGWIKEIKTRVLARGIRRDPLYIDPVSGYIFHSKKDALRYIETGDIDKCAIRPKERDQGSVTNEGSASRSSTGTKAGQSSTKRQIFTGRESSEPTNTTEPRAESIKKRLRSAARDAVNIQEAEVKTEKKPEGSGTKPVSEQRASDFNGAFGNDPQSDNLLNQQKLPEREKEKHSGAASITKSRKSRKRKYSGTPARFSKRLAGHNAEEVANLGLGERAFRAAFRNSSGIKGKTSSVQVPIDPARETHAVRESIGTETNASLVPPQEVCSVSGTEPDTSSVPAPSNPDQETAKPTETNASLVPPQEVCSVSGTEPDTSSVPAPSNPDQETAKPTETNASLVPPQEVCSVSGTEPDTSSVPAPSNPDQETAKPTEQNIGEESLSKTEEYSVPEKPITEKQDTENPPRLEDSELRYPFGDCWSDPCLEFAFKTLTGVIPVEDCLAYDHIPHPQFNPSSDNGCFDLPIFDSYTLFPNDFPTSSHPGQAPQDNNNNNNILPTPPPPPFLSPGNNGGLPSCSGVASQPHLEPRKDFPAKAKS